MNVRDRFLKYVSFSTASDEDSASSPSTPGQRVLSEYLAEELRQIGIADAAADEYGYVYGLLPASPGCEGLEPIGLIAHVDTSPAVSGEGIRPSVVRYTGGALRLANGDALTPQTYPSLASYVGQDMIVTDGTTLLGADDKAGVAEIVTLCERLITEGTPHRALAVCFTPDEEIGRGTEHFRAERFGARRAYTVDGGEVGEIEYENFNAASAKVVIHGRNIHPGSAKNKMKNAVLLAAEFIGMLPPAETPAHTEQYEGFYHVGDLTANESLAQIKIIVRDHDRARFEERKEFLVRLTAYLNGVYGEGTFETTLRDSYYNMKEKILPYPELIRDAEDAMRAAGAEPKIVPIRGGTDGAVLSYKGLPCPNLSTGGMNFHGTHECIPVPALEQMVRALAYLAAPHGGR